MKTVEFLDAVCDAIGRDPGSLSAEDTPQTIPEWDSVGHLSILSVVDEELGVAIDEADMQNFDSLAELLKKLREKGALDD